MHLELALLHFFKRIVLINLLSLKLLLIGLCLDVILRDTHHVLLEYALVKCYLPQRWRIRLRLRFRRQSILIVRMIILVVLWIGQEVVSLY